MKFSVATIAVLATAVTAQYGQPQQQYGQQAQQPQQYQPFPPQQQYNPVYGAPTAQVNKYSPAEYQEWHQCVDSFLDGFNIGKDGSAAGCQYWSCIEGVATKYGRGGALATVGNLVSKGCAVSNILPVYNPSPSLPYAF
ncbi:hypothetical protein N7499_005561 [Penicillium canescens]|uniref:Uncharacterized protein n=1 Tax=Penicillium canescens TaxID=5083 RepID=A0AAD6ICI8_PENCN|nr:uncharacterized protein N7446_001327 [Penicillium canescens]KAJ5998059.1 hypothetical protein N7522_009719 [Penicillium canescens]KAJ6043131.1 hypothetical protein N7460_004486 [Penicillium canescens]KAJ6054607.1 hypothetical protein N7444_003705 [Penicillium canescens]KAJ6073550.1 hypothetical protein N7446_001327 [Penicillium canescens]KAJ6080687.1 hypothetical protein N7499_005561 [Penicillium canescens]